MTFIMLLVVMVMVLNLMLDKNPIYLMGFFMFGLGIGYYVGKR